MKKLTVKEAIEQGLKIGDEVWLKAKVEEIGDAGSEIRAILKSSDVDLELYCFDDDEIYLPEAPAPELRKVRVGDVYECNLENAKDCGARWMQKEDCQECIKAVGGVFEKGHKHLINYFDFSDTNCWKFLYNVNDQRPEPKQKPEPKTLVVGEYWHHPKYNTEIVILPNLEFEFTKEGPWALPYGEKGSHTQIGERFDEADYDDLVKRGYIRGRHPENIEQTKQWQPKEGELVWVKFTSCKMEFVRYCDNGGLASKKYAVVKEVDCDAFTYPIPLSELEPYTNQDAPKIDFSVAGQWLVSGLNIVCTNGVHVAKEFEFKANRIGSTMNEIFYYHSTPWKICTPEQIKLIEALQQTLK